MADQVPFLERDADEDVSGEQQGERQMPHRHHRCCPDGNQEPDHQRVPHDSVQRPDGKGGMRVGAVSKVQEDLPQSEQVEVVDDERGIQDDQPAEEEQPPERSGRHGLLNLPDDRRHRAPLPEKQSQDQAACKDEGASLDRLGDEPGPPRLECRPRHDAVLHGEQSDQPEVDQERLPQGRRHTRVDRLRNQHVADKADHVEEDGEEGAVSGQPVDQSDSATHGFELRGGGNGGWLRPWYRFTTPLPRDAG